MKLCIWSLGGVLARVIIEWNWTQPTSEADKLQSRAGDKVVRENDDSCNRIHSKPPSLGGFVERLKERQEDLTQLGLHLPPPPLPLKVSQQAASEVWLLTFLLAQFR